MRRSQQVAAPLLAAAALALTTGCRKPEMQRCVDQQNAVVDDVHCASGEDENARSYRYYYGGTGGYEIGGLASNGSFSPIPGKTYSTERGGFGGSFPIENVVVVAGVIVAIAVLGRGG